MSEPSWGIVTWVVGSAAPVAALATVALIRIRKQGAMPAAPPLDPLPGVEILVPVAGDSPDQAAGMSSLLQQEGPGYRVTFIVLGRDDPAFNVVTDLVAGVPHADVLVTGPASSPCARKNHSLAEGIRHLATTTDIVVFCDATNVAPRDWLRRFVAPIVRGEARVVTTFRDFNPNPPTLGGVCQTLYAGVINLLKTFFPLPWGGGTAIRRDLLDELHVAQAWETTIVDDMVLGNLLHQSGVPVAMDYHARLQSPLAATTLTGFLHYLDRQLLFPKYTNPGIWVATVAMLVNASLALSAAFILLILAVAGTVGPWGAWSAAAAGGCFLAVTLILRSIHSSPPPLAPWLAFSAPCVLLAALVAVQTVFRRWIVWKDVAYRPGRGGIVHEVRPR